MTEHAQHTTFLSIVFWLRETHGFTSTVKEHCNAGIVMGACQSMQDRWNQDDTSNTCENNDKLFETLKSVTKIASAPHNIDALSREEREIRFDGFGKHVQHSQVSI